MKVSRRQFARLGLVSLALGGLAQRGAAMGHTGANRTVTGYGPLHTDPLGLLDLPAGFSYQVLSRAGDPMSDGWRIPDHFDGMGCISLSGNRLALVRNHELGPQAHHRGPAGDDRQQLARLAALPSFDRDASGTVLPGCTTTLVLDQDTGQVEKQYLSLVGTATNCAGGVTPWGSWLTCEETVIGPPEVGTAHGWVFEVPATAGGPVSPVALRAMGRFRHEAVAIDPVTGIAYLTEDRDDGLLYRFIPHQPGKLGAGGRLQALALQSGLRDTRNWDDVDLEPMQWQAARWVDMTDTDSPNDDLRARGYAAGAALFARGEGIHVGVGSGGRIELFFCCTSGGQGRFGQVFRLHCSEYGSADQLQLFVESADPSTLDYADNLTVAPWGDLVLCEDRSGGKTNHLRGVTPSGALYTLGRLNADTELAGACFSPDGGLLFVNAYSPGRTLVVRGPWHRRLG